MHMILVELDVWQIGDWCCGNFTSGRSSFFWPNRILLYGETHLHRMYPVEKECANLSLIWICRHCAPLALSFHYATLAFTLMSGCSKEKKKREKRSCGVGAHGLLPPQRKKHYDRTTTGITELGCGGGGGQLHGGFAVILGFVWIERLEQILSDQKRF